MAIEDGKLIRIDGSPSDNAQPVKEMDQMSVTDSGDDRGTNFNQELSVGNPGAGKEFVCGEGDSYPIPYAWHVDYANISGLTVTSATDVSSILQSDASSTTGLFDGTTSGKCLLVMSEFRYGGVKVKINTAGTVEAANVTAEYLQDNTPTWVSASYMATNSDFPYEQLGNVLGGTVGSEQWRFGFDPDNLPPTWDDVTLNVNGTDYTGKWAIIRTTGGITLDPVLEQVKMHTNRFECNADGTTEYFGRSRYPKDLHIDKYGNATKNPANESITVGVGMTMIRLDNEFTSNANDGLILYGEIPEGMDTSIPVQMEIDWYPLGNGSGDVELESEIVQIKNGFVFDGTEVPSPTTPVITSLNANQDQRQKSSFKFLLDETIPGDQFCISLYRDATGGNPDDTFGSSIAVYGFRVVGYFWRP